MKIIIEDKELIIKYRQKKDLKDIYDNICENSLGMNLNEIHIKYEIKEEDKKIKVFGNNFLDNNYNCKIVFNRRIYNISTHLDLIKMNKNKKLIEIKLKGIKSIIVANGMFNECSS